MKYRDHKQSPWALALVLIVASFLSACGGGSRQSSEESDENEASSQNENASANRAATGIISNSWSNVKGAMASEPQGAARVPALKEEEAEYDCSAEDDTTVTCRCPGGGRYTEHYEFSDESFEYLANGDVSFDSGYHAVFENCVEFSCGEEQTINGEMEGTMRGLFYTDGSYDMAFEIFTETACSGLTVGDIQFGLEIRMTDDGYSETMSGGICAGEDEEGFHFDSPEELETQNSCMAEDDSDAETSAAESDSEAEADWDDDDSTDDESDEYSSYY